MIWICQPSVNHLTISEIREMLFYFVIWNDSPLRIQSVWSFGQAFKINFGAQETLWHKEMQEQFYFEVKKKSYKFSFQGEQLYWYKILFI